MRFKKSTLSVIIILVALATIVVMSGLNFLMPQTRNNVDQHHKAEQARYGAGAEERGNISEPQPTNQLESVSMQKITLTTKDGVKIVANLYPVEKPIGWLVLAHMMPATKESWDELAKNFQNIGYESLAIDLRGHGESIRGESEKGKEIKLNYLNFSDVEHQKSILDLEAAVDYLLKERQATRDKINFIGASIGANLSLQYIVQHPEFKTAVLLSPGLNYRGIKTEPLVKNLKAGQKVFFISSRDDPNAKNNAQENQRLYELTPSEVEKKIQIYDFGGHGTQLLESQPELMGLIIEFIR